MRRWLLLVLVLLLPLRGWVGDAMAGEMLTKHMALAAAAAAAPAGHETHAHMHMHEVAAAAAAHAPEHDCAGHGQVQAHGHGHGDAHAAADVQTPQPLPNPDCGTCASCQVCSSVVLGFAVSALPLMIFGHAPPASGVPHFASAEPRAGDKPPRS